MINEAYDRLSKNLEVKPTGLYRGRVVDNRDPDGRARVRIRVNAIHGIPQKSPSWVEDWSLPWSLPGALNSAGNDMGQFLVPPVGSVVFVLFEGGDLNTPVYIGGVPSIYGTHPKSLNKNDEDVLGGEVLVRDDDLPKDIDDPASQGIVFKSLKGHTIKYDDRDGLESLQIVGADGSLISVESIDVVDSRRGNREVFRSGRIRLQAGPKSSTVIEDGIVVHTLPFTVTYDDLPDNE